MTEPLTAEQAEEMLKTLSRHFRTPVMPIDRYCEKLETWALCIQERADRAQKEVFPNLNDWDDEKKTRTAEAVEQREKHDHAEAKHVLREILPAIFTILPKEAASDLRAYVYSAEDDSHQRAIEYERMAFSVSRILTAIHKSNLLARILYSGEKLRTKICPEHKGHWSGIEWGPDNRCPHGCQLTGWIQEGDDQGKPLPGVQAVMLVPTGDDPDEVTVRNAQGGVLGKASLSTIPKP